VRFILFGGWSDITPSAKPHLIEDSNGRPADTKLVDC
jgi:hypothetical protein